ncbi:hypothetical protein EVA_16926 [gut metagenome]|uniref:Uncharacterized protein n=1 Tax=gut metagenome TaxID=749906 RepID=J9FZJ3_9ZZZZ
MISLSHHFYPIHHQRFSVKSRCDSRDFTILAMPY